MTNKTYGIILIIVGVLIVAVVFLAAPLHLASSGFGLKKLVGVVIGVVAFAAGLVLALGKGAKKESAKKE
jgi:preprotein translocase subunit SecF